MKTSPGNTLPKRLLFLLSSLNAGGAETHTVRLVNKIDTVKFDVTLRYFDKREVLLDEIDSSQVNSVECFNRKGRFDPSLLKKLGKLFAQQQYDLVMCVSPYPLLYGYLAKLIYGKKYKLITAIHQTEQRPGRWQSMKARFFRRLLNRCDLVLFVCRNQLEYWINRHKLDASKCKYIYNGIDVEYFASIPPVNGTATLVDQFNVHEDDFVLVNVAGFRTEKKQEDIVHAVQELRQQGYPVKALLVGDGPRRQTIERYIQSCGVQEHVFLTGLQRDVRPYLHIADCFVISSHQETFSMAALEAMAAGKSIVLTNVGGASEMVEDGVNGFLFAPGDIGQLVGKIRSLIDDGLSDKMGTNSKRIVAEHFTLQKMVSDYEKVLEGV